MEMKDIKSVIAELRELDSSELVQTTKEIAQSLGFEFKTNFQCCEFGRILEDYFKSKINALPQLLEYVEELERRLAQSEKLEHCSCCNQSKEEWVCLE